MTVTNVLSFACRLYAIRRPTGSTTARLCHGQGPISIAIRARPALSSANHGLDLKEGQEGAIGRRPGKTFTSPSLPEIGETSSPSVRTVKRCTPLPVRLEERDPISRWRERRSGHPRAALEQFTLFAGCGIGDHEPVAGADVGIHQRPAVYRNVRVDITSGAKGQRRGEPPSTGICQSVTLPPRAEGNTMV